MGPHQQGKGRDAMGFRHEWKHILTTAGLIALRTRLGAVLETDPHAAGGRYTIRSLYFDTPGDKALREKLDGVDRREKFRLRYYNGDTGLVLLEKKSKVNGLCRKEQQALTLQDVQALLGGEWAGLPEGGGPLLGELGRKMRIQGLGPKTLVDYTREPFIYGPGNVRVTQVGRLPAGPDTGPGADTGGAQRLFFKVRGLPGGWVKIILGIGETFYDFSGHF